LHDAQPVRVVIGAAGPPRAARVVAFDSDVAGMALDADGELLAAGAAVQDGVGGELRGGEHCVLAGRAVVQMAGYVVADAAELVGVAGVDPLVFRSRVRLCWWWRGPGGGGWHRGCS